MTINKLRASFLGIPLTLAACTTMDMGTPNYEFGQAVKANINAHAVTPSEDDKNNTYIPADSDRQALAIARYKQNEVTEPVSVRTTDE